MAVAINVAADAVLLTVDARAFGRSQVLVVVCAIKADLTIYARFPVLQMNHFAGTELADADARGDAVLLIFTTLIDLREAG